MRQSKKNQKEPITLNKIISNTKNKRKRNIPEKLVINNTIVVEKQEIAENLNTYFKNFPPTSHLKYLTNKEVLKNI